MTERYCEGERFADLSFTEETFEDCDFTDCVFVDCSFTKCELDHTALNECKFVRCEITGLRSTHSSVQSLDFEDCRLNEIEWAPLLSNGAFPDLDAVRFFHTKLFSIRNHSLTIGLCRK